ncbi:MAG: membrane protein insertion efficiency factor YidD [Gammaproteobacteria bacterium]|nr:membrane protein insertion efficiency factor YidD [Gammaproteobacteria bacterium]
MAPCYRRLLESFSRILSALGIGLIHLYRWTISPLIGPKCRFLPSCSEYALLAFKTFPMHKALWLTIRRLLRCHPFCQGGLDPLPPSQPKKDSST